jgi:1-acyl-sn-glycerol-3-phosphate acyltransferase
MSAWPRTLESVVLPLSFAFLALVAQVLLLPVVRVSAARPTALVRRPEGLIIASNHRSMLDLFVYLIIMRRWGIHPRILIRADFVRDRWTRVPLQLIGAIPAGPRTGGAVLAQGASVLRTGGVIGLMPEGRIPPPADRVHGLAHLHRGVGELAGRTGCPILLCAITNTDLAWPRDRRRPRLHLRPTRRPHVRVATDWIPGDPDRPVEETLDLVRSGLSGLLDLDAATRPRRGGRRGLAVTPQEARIGR